MSSADNHARSQGLFSRLQEKVLRLLIALPGMLCCVIAFLISLPMWMMDKGFDSNKKY